jgi:hypothetical protein
MSDFQPNPQWWQASDGKWYAPELHPNAQPSLPSPTLAPPSLPAVRPAPIAPQVSNAGANPKKPIWKRWWAISFAGVLMFLIFMAVLAPPPEDEAGATAITETAISTTLEPVPQESTTIAVEPVPTAQAPAAEATPTTEFVLSVDDVRTLVFPITFDSVRDEVLALFNDLIVVQSVDQYEYDSNTGTVHVNLTPTYDFDEGVRDDAWGIMRAMSNLWIDGWYEPASGWSPSLDVSITTAQYSCNGEQMRAMADARFTRADWETNCRDR